MCWGNFCYIPGLKKWDENARAYMLGWLPTVGFAIGAVWAAVYTGLIAIKMPFMAVCVITLWLPFMLSGFIHVDGYMDVNDALMSRGTLEKKRAILKDSTCGAFAVVSLVFLLFIEFGFLSSAISYGIDTVNLILITVISRSVAGLSVLNFTPMETSQYSAMKGVNTDPEENCESKDLKSEAEKSEDDIDLASDFDSQETKENGASAKSGTRGADILLIVQLIFYLVLAALFCTYYLATVFVLIATVLGTIIPILVAKKGLQGMNGDIAGYGIIWGEMVGIMALIFC